MFKSTEEAKESKFKKKRSSENPNKQSAFDGKSREFEEKVIEVDRVCRTVKGGKRLRFRALVAVGNRNGKVGIGIGKGQEVLPAVQKSVSHAKKDMIDVKIVNGTIPHEVKIDFGSAKLIFLPARTGTSIIAGSSVRTVLELSGIKNILSKILGSSNKINNAKATILALKNLQSRPTNDNKTNQTLEPSKEKSKNESIPIKSKQAENK